MCIFILEVVMKKIFLLFVIFAFFGILAAQETRNEPVAETEPSAAQEETGGSAETENTEVVPAAENQEKESVNEPVTAEPAAEPPVVKETPSKTEPKSAAPEQPAAAAPAEKVKENSVQPEAAKELSCESVLKNDEPSKMFYQPSVGLGIGASIFSLRFNNDFDFLLKHTKDGTNVYAGLEIDFRYSPYLDDHAVYEIPIQMNMMFDFPLRHNNLSRIALWFSAGVDLAFGYLFYYDYDDYDDDKDRDTLFKVMAAWGFGVNMLFKNDVTLKLGFDSFYGKYPDIICAAGYRF